MSLYSSLTQVLAPFAAKIKGIQTGYDGTEYESPGEAVREQINDLHVLIGHVPGRAIDASAVAYGDSDVGTELTNVNGRLGDLSNLETEDKSNIVNAINKVARSGGSDSGSGLTAEIKNALLQVASKVAYIDAHGQDYYDALYDALYPTVKSIEATFNQGSAIIYDSAEINSLKRYLTVVAVNSDGTEIVLSRSDYNLSGNLEAGVSTITVEYGTATTTFTANITEDTLQSITATYDGRTVYSDGTLDDIRAGLVVTAKTASGGSVIVPESDYTLTGDLIAGQCTFVIEYNNLTTSIEITVVEALDYTKDALENVTWTSGYMYDAQTGEIKSASGQYITDKFNVQACMYDFLPNLAGSFSYCDFYMWDSNGNYIGRIEDNLSFKYSVLNPSYKYAICLFNKNDIDTTKATLIPVDNRATASQTIVLNLSELTLKQFSNNYVASYDITAILQNYGITKDNFVTKIMGCNVIPFFVNKNLTYTTFAGSFNNLVVSIFLWQDSLELMLKKADIKNQSDFENYVATNNIKIVLN